MCRKHRRCHGPSSSKAAAAKRARSYRARRRDAQAAAANPSTPDTGNQPTSDQQPAGGNVTNTSEQPAETGKPKQASKSSKREKLTKSQKIMNQVHKNLAAEYGKPMTAKEQAAVEKANAEAEQAQDDYNAAQVAAQRAEDEQALRERLQTGQESGIRRERQAGPVNVVGDGNITIAHGGDVIRTKRATSRRTGRHIVEDHTGDTPASDEDRVWTVSSSPASTSTRDRGGRDANLRNHGITQDSAGNLTITGVQGPLHITRSGRGGRPEVVGDVTPTSNPRRPQPTQQPAQQSGRQASEKPGQTTDHKARQGDVTDSRRTDDRVRQDRRRTTGGTGGTTNVVGDGNITIVGADPSQTTVRVTNYAAPGARVGRQVGVVTGDFVFMGDASSTPDNHTADTSDMDARMRAARDAARNKSARPTTSSHTTTTPDGSAVQMGSNNVAGTGEAVAFQIGKVADHD